MPGLFLGGVIVFLVFTLVFLAAIVLVAEFVDIGWINDRRKDRRSNWPEHKCPSCGYSWKEPLKKEENDK